MSDIERTDLTCWANLWKAAQALDQVVDSLGSEEDERARRLMNEVDALRADVEARVFGALGIQATPAWDSPSQGPIGPQAGRLP